MPDYLPFDPNPRRPSKLPPPKSIDSQFHVLGPVEKYPIRAGAAYQMPSATWEAALRVHKALGIERGIIVQTTTYGADHSVVLDGLAAMGPNYRACANALVFAEADDAYLAKLDAAGVGGARFSFRKELGAVLSDKDFERAIARIRELGWYAKFQPEKDGIVGNLDKIRGLNVPVLIDHMGRPGSRARQGRSEFARGARPALERKFLGDAVARREDLEGRPAVGRCHPDRPRLYRGRTRPLCMGQRLAASGFGGAAPQRCGFAGAALSLCAR